MRTLAEQKAWVAKVIGSGYFILLGFIYVGMEIAFGTFGFSDLVVLLWCALPLMVRRRWMYLVVGSLNLLIWSYAGLAILFKGSGEVVPMLVISAVTLLSMACALMLVYAAISTSEKEFSLI